MGKEKRETSKESRHCTSVLLQNYGKHGGFNRYTPNERLRMQNKAKEVFSFDPKKLKKVPIEEVRENSWNPKDEKSPEYKKVKESIQINGLTQPVFVRTNPNDNSIYEVLDGAHRARACKELGFPEIYIYDEGEVPDDLAKSFTIFHQIQVPFDDLKLAPIVMELSSLGFELPYSDNDIAKFKNLAQFDFADSATSGPETEEDLDGWFKTLTLRMTCEQFDDIKKAIRLVSEGDNVSEGRALQLLCASGVSGYPFDGAGTYSLDEGVHEGAS